MMNAHKNKSLSHKLQEQLRHIISATSPGDKLPSEPRLAQSLGVSRATLREAMRAFETQGVIHRRQGVGTFVVHPSQVLETGLEVLESVQTISERQGMPVEMGTYQVDHRPATDKESKLFSLKPYQKVVQVNWTMDAEQRPVAFLVDILPDDVIMPKDIYHHFDGSVLDLLLIRNNITLTTSRTEITAVAATAELARALGIQRMDVLLSLEAHLYTADGRLIDHSFSYYLPGYFRFHVVRRVG
jgi:GntR family transcriptional regulator